MRRKINNRTNRCRKITKFDFICSFFFRFAVYAKTGILRRALNHLHWFPFGPQWRKLACFPPSPILSDHPQNFGTKSRFFAPFFLLSELIRGSLAARSAKHRKHEREDRASLPGITKKSPSNLTALLSANYLYKNRAQQQ